MFDARSILDILVGGGQPRQGRQPDPNVFRDMLDQLGTQSSGRAPGAQSSNGGARPMSGTQQGSPQAPQPPAGQPAPGGNPIEDLLRSILSGVQGAGSGQQGTPGAQPAPAPPQGAPEVGTELQDLLRQILQGGLQGGGGGTRIPVNRAVDDKGTAPAGEPGLFDAVKELLGQATAGAREGAGRIDDATGISGRAREALGQATGQAPEELLAKLKELFGRNQLATGAALGGLGALVLGTSAGRSLASTAVKLGGLALIGGLAYKAVQNYQQGRPILSPGGADGRQSLLPAPRGSGFEAEALSHDGALRCIRAMIAAAAADGRIDANEQQKILGGLLQAGLQDTAQQFLATEISNPASPAELAAGVSSPEEAVQVYTAARLAVDPDAKEEHAFLSALASVLGIDDELAAQVDAAARGTAA